ncbi:hypothetical protein CD006_17935 [Enterobacter sp. 10-1]|nr:hypothetical protein CD006_17935 [Enterobacter sp. 10-1]
MLVITIITSTHLEKGYSPLRPFYGPFYKHRPCFTAYQVSFFLFNRLKNNKLFDANWQKVRQWKRCIENTDF